MRRIGARQVALAFVVGAAASAAFAQGYPGAGGRGRGEGRAEGRGDSRSIVDAVERRQEATVRPNTLGVFAASLEKELPSLPLAPAAASALQDFIRELKDYATLEDRRVRERTGLAPRTVHAVPDLQRDLDAEAEYAGELSAATRDVLARWKKVRELLDDAQRKRIDAIYGVAQQGR